MLRRVAIAVDGIVQGVGFRPFVFRLAHELGLGGWVRNGADGVRIEVQGDAGAVDAFLRDLRVRLPAQASIHRLEVRELPVGGAGPFAIVPSAGDADARPTLPPELATCPDCLAEIEDRSQRRFRYPFTNCTNCGPRYSIVEGLPYDRPRTSMRAFPLCERCASEYRDPMDRRFHAQPIACPACGPQLRLTDGAGAVLAERDEALEAAVTAVLAGRIVALKGIGGYQLACDGTNASAVARLRERKRRPAKPFAVMFPDPESVLEHCHASEEELRALATAAAPIVLVRRRVGADLPETPLAAMVAPGNPDVGAMLPYTPLHRLLLDGVSRPVICTSGNVSDEPMCIDDDEALRRLGGIADLFLAHDRRIVRPVDDSVARIGPEGLEVLRRARGFAPLPVRLPRPGPTILAVGGQMKATVALAVGDQAVVSQHLGDLDSEQGASLLERTAEDLCGFLGATPAVVACDAHPDYVSTRFAERLAARLGVPLEPVQHHHAHVAACALEHGLGGEVLGLAWDGTGFGADGTIWGGEALRCDEGGFTRFARLRPFPLPGGELAVREPRRAALGLLWAMSPALAEARAPEWFSRVEASALLSTLARGVNCPMTSSLGRLFDAVAALAGLRARVEFEAQAAMELEFAAGDRVAHAAYPMPLAPGDPAQLDWEPLVGALLADVAGGAERALVAARFHDTLAEAAVTVARASRLDRVVLAGGCFQNARLLRSARSRLERAGLQGFSPRAFPPNDGALSLGQLVVASQRHAAR